MALLDWIKKSADLLDPHRRQRVDQAAEVLERIVARDREAFSLDHALARFDIYREDRPLVVERTYQRFCERAWADDFIKPKERAALQWVAGALGLSAEQARKIEWNIGLARFKASLGAALSDGILTEEEVAYLKQIAAHLGTTLRPLMMQYFPRVITDHLQSVFRTASADAQITNGEWTAVVATAARLDIGEAELLNIIRPQSEHYIEQVLAEARADEMLSVEEDSLIRSLLDVFQATGTFRYYIESQLKHYERLREIAAGQLPILRDVPMELRAGEMVHFQSNAVFARPRRRQGQIEYEPCSGQITITDARMVFSSSLVTTAVNHRKVVKILPRPAGGQGWPAGFELFANGKGGGHYGLNGDEEVGMAIYRVAVAKVNQLIVNRADDTRRIAREVRQRVWQRDGGRCVECGATQYLEFDHVIPVARGGDNSEANVQVLCRGCNAKKSDHI